jgi:hypothetical protein
VSNNFSYTDNPAEVTIDAVRFEIGDTDESKMLVSDAEINYALSKTGSNVLRACARICHALAAKFARAESVRTSTYTTEKGLISKKFKDMAAAFIARSTAATSFLCPSIEVSEKETHSEDTSIVQPAFSRGQHDNPNTESVDKKATLT